MYLILISPAAINEGSFQGHRNVLVSRDSGRVPFGRYNVLTDKESYAIVMFLRQLPCLLKGIKLKDMNLDSLNKWLSLLANLGVLAGIIFLAVEIQQNTAVSQFEALQTNRNARIEFFTDIRDSEFIASILNKERIGGEFTDDEIRRLIAHYRAAWSLEYFDWAQRKMGLAGEFSTNQVDGTVIALLDSPLGRRIFEGSRGIYPAEFDMYVGSLIAEMNSKGTSEKQTSL